jgi:pyrroline-5-carboxylate reductase
MGEAILRGMLETSFLKPEVITYYDRSFERCKYIGDKYGIFSSGDVDDLVISSRYLLIAVKPQDVIEVLGEVKRRFDPRSNKIISIAAGVSTGILEKHLGNHPSVIRIMPNTPALVNMGISAISKGRFVSKDDFDFAVGVIKSLGDYVEIKEDLQNTITAISGSGPAYFFLFCKYLIESAKDKGIDSKTAEKLVIKTMAGAAAMLEKISPDTDYLINMVTSPGGTTESAIVMFNAMDIKSTIISAVDSAEKRAEEIQKELEKK